MNLRGNKLTELPLSMRQLCNLKKLDLSENHLSLDLYYILDIAGFLIFVSFFDKRTPFKNFLLLDALPRVEVQLVDPKLNMESDTLDFSNKSLEALPKNIGIPSWLLFSAEM